MIPKLYIYQTDKNNLLLSKSFLKDYKLKTIVHSKYGLWQFILNVCQQSFYENAVIIAIVHGSVEKIPLNKYNYINAIKQWNYFFNSATQLSLGFLE